MNFPVLDGARRLSRVTLKLVETVAFFQEFFSEGNKICCYANFSIVFGLGGGTKVSVRRQKCMRGANASAPPPCGRKPGHCRLPSKIFM